MLFTKMKKFDVAFLTQATRMTVVCAAAIVFTAGQVKAVVIIPSFATTNMGSGFGTSISNTINGAGLSTFPSLTATHLQTLPSNSWVSSGTLTGRIDFDLGGLFLVDGFSFWNQNAGGPGALGSTGIRNLTVLSSSNGASFNLISGAPGIFSQVPGSTALPPEIFSFAPIVASHIRFQVANNYGDSAQTGFAEVAFSGTATTVPEPSSLAVFGLGTCALSCATLRRKKNS